MNLTSIILLDAVIVFVLAAALFVPGLLYYKRIIAEKNTLLNAVLNALPYGLFEIDINGNCLDYMAASNDIICHQYSIAGKNIREFISGDNWELIKAAMETALKSGKEMIEAFPYPDPAGEIHWYEISLAARTPANDKTKAKSFIVLARDITARVKFQLALRESEERLKLAALAGKIGIWEYDISTGKSIIICNYIGVEYPEDLLKVNFRDLVHPEDKEMVSKAFADYLSGKAGAFEVNCRINAPNLGWQWMLISCLALARDRNGKILRVAGYIKNFTRQKKTLEGLKYDKAAAEAASRAKSEFIANMSHELRTPLNAVLGLSRMLMNSGLDSRQYDYLQKIQYSAEGLLTIVNDVLDYSRYNTPELKLQEIQFDLFELINKTVSILSNSIRSKGLNLIINISENVPVSFIGDPDRLRQILLNLVGNAVKFTEKGSISINVNVSAAETASSQVILEFSIEDTGIGISPQQRLKLFKPFSQGDPGISKTYGGTGLGLAISKNLIEKMDGKISLESRPGYGSKFDFTVGLTPAPAASILPKPELRGSKAVMLIENPVLLSHTARLLKLLGMGSIIDGNTDNPPAFEDTDFLFCQPDGNGVSGLSGLVPPQCKVIAAGTFESNEYDDLQLIYPFGLNQLHNCLTGLKPAVVPVSAAPLKILVVDDNEVNLMVAEECLSSAGHHVTRASGGQEALKKLQQEYYNLVLMDLHMPVMDGLETSRRIRKLPLAGKPVIIALTADIDEAVRKKALNTWVDDYITKPFDPGKLLFTIEKWRTAAEADALDISSALKRLGGDYIAYMNILGLFVKNHKNFVHELKTALIDKDYPTAVLLCHSMKGVAANIGAESLSLSAAAAEQELRAVGTENTAPLVFPVLEKQFGRVYSSAAVLAEKNKNLEGQAQVTIDQITDLPQQSETAGTDTALGDELEALISLTERGDFEAFERFRLLRPLLLQSFEQNRMGGLEEAIRQMDWEAALKILKELLIDINII